MLRQGCEGLGSFCLFPEGKQKNRSEAEPGAARPGAQIKNNIVEKYIYGEGQPSPQTNNLRGNLYQHYDTGGLEQMAVYDFKNTALSTERWLAQDYKNVVDWPNSSLESSSYVIATTFDALGRIKTQTAPDGSIITPSYSERGVLVSEAVNQSGTPTTPLTNIKYDAKGQRTRVENGNTTYTEYTYNQNTFRLTQLLTKNTSGNTLQYLNYTYDAVGNITHIEDKALATVFYNNSIIPPIHNYTYDALYRLKEATGREMLTMANFGSTDNWDDALFKIPFAGAGSVNLQNYKQQYDYDNVGNITELRHIGDQMGSYTRVYKYNGNNNRLTDTIVGSNPAYSYAYHPKHGFLTSMPHLPVLKWNFKEEICQTSKQSANLPAVPETTWYQYDSKGKRLRKITENQSGNGPGTQKNQRIYIEGYEYYEDFSSGDQTHTLSLIDEGRRFVMYENSSSQGSVMRYQHPNHQGSCTLETDDTGQIINYEEYHPFGTTSYQATDQGTKASAKRYRYVGKERDGESGLYYYGARYYAAWTCRFISVDPLASKYIHQSPYVHADNNPITKVDHMGKGTDPADGDIPGGEPKINPTTNSTEPTANYFKNLKTGQVEWREVQGKIGSEVSLKGSKDTWQNLGSEMTQDVMDAVGSHIMSGGGFKAFLSYYENPKFGEKSFFDIAKNYPTNASGFPMGTLAKNASDVKPGMEMSEMTKSWIANTGGWTREKNDLEHHVGMFLMTSRFGPGSAWIIGTANEARGLIINDEQSGNMKNAIMGEKTAAGTSTAFEWADLQANKVGRELFSIWSSKTPNPEKYSTYWKNMPRAERFLQDLFR